MIGRDHDVIIAGGGLVGAALACALADLPLRILVVEAVPPRAPPHAEKSQPSYDDRNTALSYGSQRIVAGLGLWPALEAEAAPIRHIHISDRGRLGRAELHAAEHGVPALGYVMPNRVLGQALYARLLSKEGALGNVTLRCPAKVVELDATGARARCVIEDDSGRESVAAALIVVADGAGSELRAKLGVDVSRFAYGQSAVIANVTAEVTAEGWAFERFTEQGPVALLPRATGDLAAIVTVAEADAAALAAAPPEAYAALLRERFGDRLGRFTRIGARAHYPLVLTRAITQVVGRAVVVGNAAHALHPVAAQGFNLSLRDIAALAEVIADALATGSDAGDAAALARYAAWRAGDQRTMSVLSDSLARVFANPLATVGVARSLGLLAFDLLPPAKRAFAKEMMGLGGRLPRLARGLPLRGPEFGGTP